MTAWREPGWTRAQFLDEPLYSQKTEREGSRSVPAPTGMLDFSKHMERKNMTYKNRWTEAQSYERSFWERAANRIAADQAPGLDWYQWKADRLRSLIDRAKDQSRAQLQDMKALEVGSGPVGIVSYLRARQRVAIDPLCNFYGRFPELVKNRDPGVDYQNVEGEALPFADGCFNLVIIDNVIDHVQNADQVMTEIHRVLAPRGILYFTVNVHPPLGGILHRIVSKLRIDRGHPHTFTLNKANRFLRTHGFNVHHEEWEDYRQCRAKDLGSPSLKDKAKALGGLSEFLYTAVALKPE